MGKPKSEKTFSWDVYLPDGWAFNDPVHFLPKDGSAHFIDKGCDCDPKLLPLEGSDVFMYKHRTEIEMLAIPSHLPENI